jgi:integrase
VPCPPPLTALLHTHIQEFGVQPDGRLFVGERNDGELPTMTIGRVWRRARQAAFIPEVAASPLARTPYDLRHAAVSTWLNAGVPPTTVAEWAGALGGGLAQDLRQVPRRRRRAHPPARPGGPRVRRH